MVLNSSKKRLDGNESTAIGENESAAELMTAREQQCLDIDALQASKAFNISNQASEALSKIEGISSTVKASEAILAGNGAAIYAQQQLLGTRLKSLTAIDFARVERLNELFNPYVEIQKSLQQNRGIMAAIEASKLHESQIANISAGFQATQLFSKHLDQVREISKRYADFRLPPALETARLLADTRLNESAVAAYARTHTTSLAAQKDFISSISRPWMRQFETARSAAALMELHGLGSALKSSQGFNDALTAALRVDFGDWRDRISFPDAIFDDPIARTGFYAERGFDSALTDFPDETFQETLVLVGLDTDSDDGFEPPEAMQAVDPIEEAAFQRTNKCHNLLQRLERRLRQFIDESMTTQYGNDWPKKRLPPDVLEAWERKKSRAEEFGMVLAMLIEVADFTDYEKIICRKDNWKDVFQVRFKRQESVRESFQRLYPVRLATMHARFVTKEDELYVLAECTRLLNALSA